LTLERGPRTVVVAGDRAGRGARWLAEAGGWPLLAEPTSGARSGRNAVAAYRLLLGRPGLGGAVERVVVLGRPTLSRPVTALLVRDDVEVVLVADHPDDRGPGRPVGRVVGSVVPAWLAGRPEGWYREPADPWLRAWQVAGAAARKAVDGVLGTSGLSGPLVARELWACLGPHERLVVAASNAIRDLDLAGHPWPDDDPRAGDGGDGVVPPCDRVLANRGVSGIDGTLSTAVGVAAATGSPTRVLVGDLAFLHDLGGLAVPARERDVDVQVVVLDDDGGAIFGLLEHGEPARAASFERVFGTPHGADLAGLARGLGLPVTPVDDVGGLRAALAEPAPGLSVLHVPVRRDGLRALHERVRAAVAQQVDEAMADGAGAT
jgi:2-succinyl-5-enolpyruvyl-6-hydroxy-3-cyclohexene-1-carboxylate synthase